MKANGYFECYIPSDVLYKMNTDTALRQKVYDMLADYSSDKFKLTMQTLNPPVKKCTLVFDDSEQLSQQTTTGRVFCGFRILQISRGLPSAEIFQ